MLLYLDIDSRRILSTPTRVISRLELKRRDNDTLEIVFLREGIAQQLPVGTTARVGIKTENEYASDFLAVTTLAQTGTGTATVYSGEINLNTTAMAAAFAEEPATLAAMFEVEWTSGTALSSSRTLPVTIANDVIRGDEGDPAELPIFYTAETSDFLATQAQAEAGTDNVSWMSPLRTKQAIAELAATDWDSVTDKPTEFPPETHNHTASQITDFSTAVAAVSPPVDWTSLTGKPSEFPPATHQHDVGDVNGLQSALDGKQASGNYAAASHQHAASDITSGTLAIARIPTGTTSSTVALGNHTHAIADVIGLQDALDYKQPAGTYVTATGGITTIAVVATMPASPNANTLYVVTA